MSMTSTDEALHGSDVELLDRRIMELALEKTGAHHGAILLWDDDAKGLAIHFHVVEGLIVTLPDEVLPLEKNGRPHGVASHVFSSGKPYVCRSAAGDPYYAPYYFDVESIAAVPIPYQARPIGVLSVSSRRTHAFDGSTIRTLEEIAASSAKFLRRAQLYRAQQGHRRRPYLIKGLSPAWLEVERRIERVAGTNAPVLVCGESGTGKELVANAIHFNSARSKGPFVTVNCAAIPDALLESVLFGHVKGAFTGATADKKGEIVKAHGGTLFLDELGELPVPLQAKILRAVEDGEVSPVGSNDAPLSVDVRLVCATNRDLPAMAREGRFREDLYYRLSVMTMELPPLRAYKDGNIEVLACCFLKQAAHKHGREVVRISPEALALLYAYEYPGNVRELKNALEHAVIMASSDTVQPGDLPRAIAERAAPVRVSVPPRATLDQLRERWLAPLEKAYLASLLEECRGNVRTAASRAGLSPVTMYRLLDKHGMGRKRYSSAWKTNG